MSIESIAAPLLVGLLLAMLALLWRAWVRNAGRARTTQIELAAGLLQRHGDGLEKLLSDPALPSPLKRELLILSDSLDNRELMVRVAGFLVGGSHAAEQDEAGLAASLDDLRKNNVPAYHLCADVIVDGVFGAVLRWPETAAIFQQLAAKRSSDPKEIVATTSRARHPELPFGLQPSQVW